MPRYSTSASFSISGNIVPANSAIFLPQKDWKRGEKSVGNDFTIVKFQPHFWTKKLFEPCPFEFGLRKFELDYTLVIFSSFLKKITSGSLIMYLGEFDFSTNVYVVKITST